MVEKVFSVVKRGRYAVAGAIFALSLLTAGVATFTQGDQASANSCDRVNIVYCGLNGSGASGYINSFRADYNRGSDNGHNDLKRIYNWAGASSAKVAGMNTSNTKVGTLYRNGDIKVNGQKVGHDSWVSARFTEGKGFVQISSGVWARKTTTSFANASVPVIVHFNTNGVADFAVMVGCGNAVKFTPVHPPKPQLSCVSLTRDMVGTSRKFTFAARANADNTKITKYVFAFGDKQSDNVKTSNQTAKTSHTYSKYDTQYTARVTVYSTDFNGGKTSNHCQVTLKTPKQPTQPSLVCAALKGYGDKLNYTFTASAVAKKTTITGYTFHFSDGTVKTVKTSQQKATLEHQFAEHNKQYTVYVTVSSKDKTTKQTSACTFTLTTPKQDECKPGVPVGSPECNECKPGIPAGSTECTECLPGVPAGSDECTPATPTTPEKPETPEKLANTGPGAIIGLFGGTSLAGGLLHRFILRRKYLA